MTIRQQVLEEIADSQSRAYYPPTTLIISLNLWEKLLYEIFSDQTVVYTVPDKGEIRFMNCRVLRVIEPDYLRAY